MQQPDDLMTIVLSQHETRPEDDRPLFLARPLCRRDSRRLQAAYAALQACGSATSLDEANAALDQCETAVKTVLVGWAGQRAADTGEPLSFDLDQLDRVCDEADLAELLARIIVANQLSVQEKKASGRRPSSPPASTAPSTAQLVAAVDAARTSPSVPSSCSAPPATAAAAPPEAREPARDATADASRCGPAPAS